MRVVKGSESGRPGVVLCRAGESPPDGRDEGPANPDVFRPLPEDDAGTASDDATPAPAGATATSSSGCSLGSRAPEDSSLVAPTLVALAFSSAFARRKRA